MSISHDDVIALFTKMQSQFNSEKAVGVNAIIQINLTGDAQVSYWLEIKDQRVTLHEGESENPNMTLIADAADYAALIHGEINAISAFMNGKITVKGDMGLAMKLQPIFGL